MLIKNCEIIFMTLWDVGQSINLALAREKVSGIQKTLTIQTKDTPHKIVLPSTLQLDLIHKTGISSSLFSEIRIHAKLYQDGVISFLTYVYFPEIELDSFHTVRKLTLPFEKDPISLDEWITLQYNQLRSEISYSISLGLYDSDNVEPEKYTFFCIRDPTIQPSNFFAENSKYVATLLIGENPDIPLHPKIIQRCLQNPFSFLENDMIIFDIDRAIIIDPYLDYEDIVLITELANYQLLELRVLDEVLNRWQKIAEKEINSIYKAKRRLKRAGKVRLEEITKVRYVAVFILYYIQNVSKIIGDYFLAQIYTHLCELFQLDEW
ncbi:MAG: hypothetical protein E4G98_04080, partial [Promethearchaeota archaeon]